jgi:hypothetical protein
MDLQEGITRFISGGLDAALGSGNELNRNGVQLVTLNLADAALLNGKQIPEAVGKGLRLLRHGSNPGARLELSFSGTPADNLWAPGKAIRGGFDGISVKLAKGSARVGIATLAIVKSGLDDFSEDLLIGAIGPVDLLGTSDVNGDVSTYVSVAKNTDPAGANPTGSFDGSGWELLRVLVDTGAAAAANCTTLELHPWTNPYYSGSNWFNQSIDVISVPDTPTSGGRYRSLTVPWAGRGMGYFGVYNVAGTMANCGLIVQGLK